MQIFMNSCTSDKEILSLGHIRDFEPQEENTKGKFMTYKTYL